MSSKNATHSDFVREAIREKATRDLSSLTQRFEAFGGIERSRDSLFTVASELTTSAAAVAAVATDPTVATRVKKLRKLVDDAHVLATEIADALGIESQRDALAAARQSILEALKSAGIDPNVVVAPSAGGDAQ